MILLVFMKFGISSRVIPKTFSSQLSLALIVCYGTICEGFPKLTREPDNPNYIIFISLLSWTRPYNVIENLTGSCPQTARTETIYFQLNFYDFKRCWTDISGGWSLFFLQSINIRGEKKPHSRIFPWQLPLKLSLNDYLEGVTEHFSSCGLFSPVAFWWTNKTTMIFSQI